MSSASNSRNGKELLLPLKARHRVLTIRHQVLRAIREFFDRQGYLAVDTPLRLPTVAPEEHISPLRSENAFLATSPELEMKALVASGLSPIYQVTRSFRKGEQGSRHVPEFTILEWYRAGDSVEALAQDLEGLFRHVARALSPEPPARLTWQGHEVDLEGSFLRTPVQEAFQRLAGWDPVADFDADRFDLDLTEKVEPHLGRGRPEVLYHYPTALGSLSRPLPANPALCQRLELYVEGLELANGFVELNDPEEQRRRFAATRATIAARGEEPPPMPEAFLDILPHLPDTVGIALGVDRMVMLFADVATIDPVSPGPILQ